MSLDQGKNIGSPRRLTRRREGRLVLLRTASLSKKKQLLGSVSLAHKTWGDEQYGCIMFTSHVFPFIAKPNKKIVNIVSSIKYEGVNSAATHKSVVLANNAQAI